MADRADVEAAFLPDQTVHDAQIAKLTVPERQDGVSGKGHDIRLDRLTRRMNRKVQPPDRRRQFRRQRQMRGGGIGIRQMPDEGADSVFRADFGQHPDQHRHFGPVEGLTFGKCDLWVLDRRQQRRVRQLHGRDLAIEARIMAGGDGVPLHCDLLLPGGFRRAARPIGGAGPADRIADTVIHVAEMRKGLFRVFQETQGDPPGKPFRLRKARAVRHAMVGGDGIGALRIAGLQQVAGQDGPFVPPSVGVGGLHLRPGEQFNRTVVEALAPPPAHAFENKARIVFQIGRHGGDGRIHAAGLPGKPDAGLPQTAIGVGDAAGLPFGGGVFSFPDQSVQAVDLIRHGDERPVLPAEFVFLAAGHVGFAPGMDCLTLQRVAHTGAFQDPSIEEEPGPGLRRVVTEPDQDRFVRQGVAHLLFGAQLQSVEARPGRVVPDESDDFLKPGIGIAGLKIEPPDRLGGQIFRGCCGAAQRLRPAPRVQGPEGGLISLQVIGGQCAGGTRARHLRFRPSGWDRGN